MMKKRMTKKRMRWCNFEECVVIIAMTIMALSFLMRRFDSRWAKLRHFFELRENNSRAICTRKSYFSYGSNKFLRFKNNSRLFFPPTAILNKTACLLSSKILLFDSTFTTAIDLGYLCISPKRQPASKHITHQQRAHLKTDNLILALPPASQRLCI